MRINKVVVAILLGGACFFSQTSCSQQDGKGEKDTLKKESGKKQQNRQKGQKSSPDQKQLKKGNQGGQGAPQMGGSNIDVSDEELKKFVEISKEIRPIQMEGQKKMRSNIEESELGMKRYQEISRAKRSGKDQNVTDKEQKQMDNIRKQNREVQEQNREKIKEKVKAKGMEWERFMKVSRAIQNDPQLKQKAMKMMQPQGRGAPQQQGGGAGGGRPVPLRLLHRASRRPCR